MTISATHVEHVTLTKGALATPFTRPRPRVVASRLRRAARIAGDLLGLWAIVLVIPFAILAVAMPVVVCVRLALWLARLL